MASAFKKLEGRFSETGFDSSSKATTQLYRRCLSHRACANMLSRLVDGLSAGMSDEMRAYLKESRIKEAQGRITVAKAALTSAEERLARHAEQLKQIMRDGAALVAQTAAASLIEADMDGLRQIRNLRNPPHATQIVTRCACTLLSVNEPGNALPKDLLPWDEVKKRLATSDLPTRIGCFNAAKLVDHPEVVAMVTKQARWSAEAPPPSASEGSDMLTAEMAAATSSAVGALFGWCSKLLSGLDSLRAAAMSSPEAVEAEARAALAVDECKAVWQAATEALTAEKQRQMGEKARQEAEEKARVEAAARREMQDAAVEKLRVLVPKATIMQSRNLLERFDWDVSTAAREAAKRESEAAAAEAALRSVLGFGDNVLEDVLHERLAELKSAICAHEDVAAGSSLLQEARALHGKLVAQEIELEKRREAERKAHLEREEKKREEAQRKAREAEEELMNLSFGASARREAAAVARALAEEKKKYANEMRARREAAVAAAASSSAIVHDEEHSKIAALVATKVKQLEEQIELAEAKGNLARAEQLAEMLFELEARASAVAQKVEQDAVEERRALQAEQEAKEKALWEAEYKAQREADAADEELRRIEQELELIAHASWRAVEQSSRMAEDLSRLKASEEALASECLRLEDEVAGLAEAPPSTAVHNAAVVDDEDGAMDQVLEEMRTASIDELRVLAPNATVDYCRKLLERCDWDVTAAACEMLVPPGAPPSPRQHAAQPQLGRLEALRKNSTEQSLLCGEDARCQKPPYSTHM